MGPYTVEFVGREVEERALVISRWVGHLHPIAAKYLATKKGLDSRDEVERFLQPRWEQLIRPTSFPDFSKGISLVRGALEAAVPIGIFSDYDADGISSMALWLDFFDAFAGILGRPVMRWPRLSRRDEGYGFTREAAWWFVNKGVKLVILLDLGTRDIEAISVLRSRGIRVVVLDHHEVPSLPHPADAFINAKRPDSEFPFRDMATAGLSFYFLTFLTWELTQDLPPKQRDLARRTLLDTQVDLAALGTITDVVPLVGINRLLARHGIKSLNWHDRKHFPRPGIQLLSDPDNRGYPYVSYRDVAWKIGPKINAASRMGDPSTALKVLRARTREDAITPAITLENMNRQRREQQRIILEEALEMVESTCSDGWIVVAKEGWDPSLVGIVAGRLADRYRRPAVVLAIDTARGKARGSARAGDMADLSRAIEILQNRLGIWGGGHTAAAGLSVGLEALPRLKEVLDEDYPVEPVPRRYTVLERTDVATISSPTLGESLQLLAPFGEGNEAPVVMLEGVHLEVVRRYDGGYTVCRIVDPSTGDRITATWMEAPQTLEGVWDLIVEIDVKAGPPATSDSVVSFEPAFYIREGNRRDGP